MSELEVLPQISMGMHPFLYDHQSSKFIIDGQEKDIKEIDYMHDITYPLTDPVSAEDVPNHPAHFFFGFPITTPRFRAWVLEKCTKADILSTKQVIHETFIELTASDQNKSVDSIKGGKPYSVEVGLIRPGHLTFSTIGNCACLGVSINGNLIGGEDMDVGYAEYEFHNTDMIVQQISLLAGLGHIARISQGR